MSDVPAGTIEATLERAEQPGLSPIRASWRRFCRNRLALGSLVILGLIALLCFAGPLFFPYGVEDADFENISAPVNLFSAHPFGTDDFGRDLLLRVLDGGRVSLAVGFVGALAAVFIGVIYGATSGYVGGLLDNVLMRTVDVLYGIPYFFLVVLINLLVGRTTAGLFVSIVVVLWLTPAVIARGQAVSLRHREFVDAARAGGMTEWQIILQHIVPNSLNVVIVYSSLLVLEVIITESFLSFLGLGVQAPASSWGSLIDAGARSIETDLRLLLLPGGFLVATLFCLNFVADGLRDAFDPNER
ncbi:MAG: ABC transporter permease subunit [Rhodospirillaceae bacterium]|jgi:oligopeptide transport system permease protein|nr:ABC transporter permease subunit [Rhodospirillaceae bacterium]